MARAGSLDACSVKLVDASRVRSARRQLTPEAEIDRICSLFRLLGDPTRVRVLEALLVSEELCVCDIAATIGALETTVSQALRFLRATGAVQARRAGRMVYYQLADGTVRRLLADAREDALPNKVDSKPRRRSGGPR
ncbi:MAG: metalloregulator ArsR/SmtB family transcription factor [Kofleriaceae bacterium]|nr:metalloregulator ArsR/SmtB family transcription factor [Kofleriaceae bacterium]